MFKNFIKLLVGDTSDVAALTQLPQAVTRRFDATPRPLTDRELIQHESRIGAQLFGPTPAGQRREFFCVDENSWIWYEEWKDAEGKPQQSTIRYEVQPAGILKIQEGARYNYLEGDELNNFMASIAAYQQQVSTQLYGQILKTV